MLNLKENIITHVFFLSFAYERHTAHIHMIIKLFPYFCMSGVTAATTAVTLPMGNHVKSSLSKNTYFDCYW